MSTRQRKNNPWKRLALPSVCLLLAAYFMHHSFSGRYGLEAQRQYTEEIRLLENRLVSLRSTRKKAASRVSLLRAGSIEQDMLDEQLRYHLNMARTDEIVLRHN